MVCKDGTIRLIEWTVTPFPGRDVLFGIGRDITAVARLAEEQAALRRAATTATAPCSAAGAPTPTAFRSAPV
ncbi:hypothetical protein ACQP2X_17400 [Actinoplanes sp. CA-131856]